ncbi:MAG: hypothetical protein WKF50_10485 [Nocardioides sp.]
MTSMDTLVEGDPGAVTKAATWLRDTLAKNLETAGDDQQDARNDARGSWEGETASSYQNFAGDILKASDLHEERVKRAATALDQYSARLQRCINDMTAIRGRATSGGLTVAGTVIHQPPDVQPGVVEPGSPEETAREAAVDKIELWNGLVEDTTRAYQDFADWVDSQLPPDVTDAQQKDASDSVLDELLDLLPNFAAGSGAGLTGFGLLGKADDYKAEAREFRRKSRVSGDPGVRGSADTPSGKVKLDDLLGKAEWLKKGGRFLGGPAGILIDIGFGIQEGRETGDWTRVALTSGTSIAVGVGVAALVAAGIVTAPAWAVVLAGGALAAGAAWGVGQIYDNWDDITDWTGDRVDDVQDFASDTWDDATDAVGDAWDSVTPW